MGWRRLTESTHTHRVWEMGWEEVWNIKRSYAVHLKDRAVNAHAVHCQGFLHTLWKENTKLTNTRPMTPQHTNDTNELLLMNAWYWNIILKKLKKMTFLKKNICLLKFILMAHVHLSAFRKTVFLILYIFLAFLLYSSCSAHTIWVLSYTVH